MVGAPGVPAHIQMGPEATLLDGRVPHTPGLCRSFRILPTAACTLNELSFSPRRKAFARVFSAFARCQEQQKGQVSFAEPLILTSGMCGAGGKEQMKLGRERASTELSMAHARLACHQCFLH